MLCGVKHNSTNAGGRWLLQYDCGSLVIPFRITSLIVHMVRSTYPFALLLPTVMVRWVIPMCSHSRWRLPWNSDPLSVRMNRGFPQNVMMRW